MRSALLSAPLAFALVISPAAIARGGSSHSGSSHTSSHSESSHTGSHSGGSHSASHSGSFHSGGAHSASRASSSHSSGAKSSASHSYPGVKRDSRGKIVRDPHAKEAFRKTNPCPSTGKTYGNCPGYVVDHVQALKHGGADDPSNMQWQTRQAAKEKDKLE